MRMMVARWLDHEFVTLTGEANPSLPPAEGIADLLRRYDEALKGLGLSLQNAVRGRLWGRDRQSWTEGSRERFKHLTGDARAASSSYLAPVHFDSAANVGFDLFAMRPNSATAKKAITDYDPPTNVMRFMVYDGIVILSGTTYDQGVLVDQLRNILPRIEQSLLDAGSSWKKVAHVSCFLHRSESIASLNAGLREVLGTQVPEPIEYSFVDGFSTPGKLIEIEVTATQ